MKKTTMIALSATALLMAACVVTLSQGQQQTAELGAVRYASASNADFVSCSGQDSNSDGYTTCTMKDRASQKLTEMVCSYDAVGCKLK